MNQQKKQKNLNLFVITDLYTACGIIEDFVEIPHNVDTEQAHVMAWQYLIDTDVVWTLQGWYGRTAQDLIARGICNAREE